MSQSLYVIAGEYASIANKLEESDLPPEVIADTLESLSGDLQTKATNVAMFSQNLRATAEAIREAAKAQVDRAKAIERKADQIEKYLKDNMERTGITKIECPYFVIAIKQNPPSVVIDDESALGMEYFNYPEPPKPTPDKKLIGEVLKNGGEVAGAHLERGTRLEIKA
jgi:hypothetical protein